MCWDKLHCILPGALENVYKITNLCRMRMDMCVCAYVGVYMWTLSITYN